MPKSNKPKSSKPKSANVKIYKTLNDENNNKHALELNQFTVISPQDAFDKLTVSDNNRFDFTTDLNDDNVIDKYIETKLSRDDGNTVKCVKFLHSHFNSAKVLKFMDKFQEYPKMDMSEIKSMVKKYGTFSNGGSLSLIRNFKLVENDQEKITVIAQEIRSCQLLTRSVLSVLGKTIAHRTLIFTNCTKTADFVNKSLQKRSLHCVSADGSMSLGDIRDAVALTAHRKSGVLVATVGALDELELPEFRLVINYEIPHIIEYDKLQKRLSILDKSSQGLEHMWMFQRSDLFRDCYPYGCNFIDYLKWESRTYDTEGDSIPSWIGLGNSGL